MSDTTLRVERSGVVYRNPRPELRAVHTWHPSIALLPGGELVAAFDLGQGPESLDYRTWISRSSDGGGSWSEPRRMFGDPPGRPTTHTVRITALSDGLLVGLGGLLYRDDPERGVVNPETFGYTDMDLVWLSSSDAAATWEGPHIIHAPLEGPSFEVCHALVELPDGSWLAPTSTWKGWDGRAPEGMKAVALVSRDGGASWPEYLTVMDGYADGIIYFEQGLTVLADGRLLAVAWAFHESSGRSLPNRYSLSADGRTFSEPRECGLQGETAKLRTLADGRILCLYRATDRPGLWAHVARIEGDRWVGLGDAPVWQGGEAAGPGGRMGGGGSNASELAGLKFGFPSMVETEPGKVFAVFWCQEQCINNVRYAEIVVE